MFAPLTKEEFTTVLDRMVNTAKNYLGQIQMPKLTVEAQKFLFPLIGSYVGLPSNFFFRLGAF